MAWGSSYFTAGFVEVLFIVSHYVVCFLLMCMIQAHTVMKCNGRGYLLDSWFTLKHESAWKSAIILLFDLHKKMMPVTGSGVSDHESNSKPLFLAFFLQPLP